jgi:hypothetical protein
MDIFLNQPTWLWLLALAVIPLLVHLLSRSRPAEYQFSDLTFLKNIVKKSSRYRKPKDRLVLILRTLAALALLFAFLHPLLVSKDPSVVVGAEDNVIYVIDQSASMSAVEGSTTRFTEACNKAAAIMAKTKPDNANIVWIKSIPSAEFPAPGPNINYLAERLQQADASSENGAIASAMKLAIDQLSKVKGNREIIVISDFQKQAWENAELFVPESIKFTKVAVGDTRLPNVAIETLRAFPISPVSGQNVSISARVKNYSDKAVTTTVYLNAGGGRQSKEIEIAANGQAEVEFNTQFSHHGNIEVTVSLGEDAFRGDDERHMIIPIKETLRMISVTSEEKSATVNILKRLAIVLPWLSHSQSEELPGINACDVLFIHRWGGDHLEELIKLSNNGTSVIVSPSPKTSLVDLRKLLDLSPVDALLSQKKDAKGWKAVMAKESAAVFSIFSSGEFGNPAQGNFLQRYELPKQWNNTAIINYTDEIPAILISNKSNASRLIWNLSFDPAHSDWVSQEPFVTFMAELILSIQPNIQADNYELLVGGKVSWILPETLDSKSIKLTRSTKEELETKIKNTTQGAMIQSLVAATPGIYEWRTGSTIAHRNVVNFPSTESNLTLLNPSDLPTGETADQDDIIRAEALSQGMPMWPWLLGAVIALLIAESLAATPQSKRQIIST